MRTITRTPVARMMRLTSTSWPGKARSKIWVTLFKDRNRLLNLKELKSGYSALHCACELGHKDDRLSDQEGCYIGFQRFKVPHAAHEYNKGFTDLARLLIEKGADIKCKDRECWTSLHHAVEHSHIETCTMLIKKGWT